MRLGLVTGEFPPMEGGVGAFTEQLGRALAGLGHEIHIITSKKARPGDAPRTPASLFEPIDLGYGQLHPRAERWRWPTMSAVADIAIRHDLELVNIQYQAAAYNMRDPAIHFLPWRLKGVARTVVTFHDLRAPYLFPRAGRLRERALRVMARQAQGVIATNAADARTLSAWTTRPVRRIPIGSNIEAYTPNHIEIAEAREKLGLAAGDFLLGYFGFLNESKGADKLIDALARLSERFHLVFIGGPLGDSDAANNQEFLAQLKSRTEQAGLDRRVHWTGFLQPARVSTYLSAVDLMVMPYRDGASLRRGTLMAALAHGRPLVSTFPTEEEPALVHGNNIWLTPTGDDKLLAEAITLLSGKPELRRELSRNAQKLAETFSWDRIAAKTADFFAELIAAT